jgi:hypothetical protein
MRLREQKLRDLGGLSSRCTGAISSAKRLARRVPSDRWIHELDTMLGPARPTGGSRTVRCDCGAPLLWGSRFVRAAATGRCRGGRRRQVSDPVPSTARAQRDRGRQSGVLPGVRHPPRPRTARGRRHEHLTGTDSGTVGPPRGLPALVGLVIAVLGAGAAIAISSDGEEPSAISTATGGSLIVTNDGSTLTARATESATTATIRRRRHRSRRPPRSRRQTRRRSSGPGAGAADDRAALPQANGPRPRTRRPPGTPCGSSPRRCPRPGRYASLHPGYYVLFTGLFTRGSVECAPTGPGRFGGLPARDHPVAGPV